MPTRYGAISLFVFLCFATDAVFAQTEAVDRYFDSSDGVRLHYLEAGTGPAIVFVPGWTMPAEIWEPQLRYFSKSFRVIAFDPRGQGKSDIARTGYVAERRARDIAELIDRIGEPVVLVAWSLGVMEALVYVTTHGTGKLRALVLIDNSIGEVPPPSYDPTFLKRLRQNRKATTEEFVRSMYHVPQSEKYIQELTSYSMRMPLDASIALLNYPQPRKYWKEAVYRTDRPLLYVVSEEALQGQAKHLKKNRPAAWIEVFEKSGHALFVDEAQRFNRVLEDFLKKEVPNKEPN